MNFLKRGVTVEYSEVNCIPQGQIPCARLEGLVVRSQLYLGHPSWIALRLRNWLPCVTFLIMFMMLPSVSFPVCASELCCVTCAIGRTLLNEPGISLIQNQMPCFLLG